ncbi:hypothetical protein [Clostridium sp. D33t1_170424_F3]|uniref:phage tail assembly chaperone n=1 Tax=Clostridium sp. D33t1_170424_F3 TaxID=2787099 RepID=UPI0018AC476A|nr:hypothetical protein [Clostridium sp. D33t1_170424_F3]
MANGNLKFFMLEELKKDEIVEVPGTDTFKSEDGKPIPFKIRVLETEEINRIRNAYRTRKMAVDKKSKPIIANGEVVFTTDYDAEGANDKIMSEAFVFPDMHDKDLMAFYGCYDAAEMPRKLFRKPADYTYASRMVAQVLGLIDKDDDELIDDAKN